MKLNYDCLRATLLAIESVDYFTENENGNIEQNRLWFDQLVGLVNDKKDKYNKADIFYSVQNLAQADYIDVSEQLADNRPDLFYINYITYFGHQFLEQIKSDNVWGKTKGILSKIGSCSVEIITQVSAQVITNLINQQMQV